MKFKVFTMMVVFIIATAGISLKSQAQSTQDVKQKSMVSWEKTKHDFGKVKQNKAASYEFTFTNKSNTPVVISNVRSSCGCTVGKYEKSPVLPGKDSKFKVTYNSRKEGRFRKTITVTFGGGEKYFLTVEGIVEKA